MDNDETLWTPEKQKLFGDWLNDQHPNADSASVIALGEAWQYGISCSALLASKQAQQEPTEYQGWYCAHCQRGVDASEVTYHEQHQECGRVITSARPPATRAALQPAQTAPLTELRGRIKDMQDAAYTYGDHSKEAVSIALDGVLEEIDALLAQGAAPSQDGEAEKVGALMEMSLATIQSHEATIAELRAQISTARADGFAQCKEMAKTELRKERDASKDYEGVSLAYNGALSLINALQCPEQPAEKTQDALRDVRTLLCELSDFLRQQISTRDAHERADRCEKALAGISRNNAAHEQPAAPSEDKPVDATMSADDHLIADFKAWAKRRYEPTLGKDWQCVTFKVSHGDVAMAAYKAGRLDAAREQPAAPSEDKPVESALSNPPHEDWMDGFSARRLITDSGFDGYELVVHGRRFTPYPNEFEYLLMLMQSAVDKPAAQSDSKDAYRDALQKIIGLDQSGPMVYDDKGRPEGRTGGEISRIARAALAQQAGKEQS